MALLYSRMSADGRGRVRLAFSGQYGDEEGAGVGDEAQECSLM